MEKISNVALGLGFGWVFKTMCRQGLGSVRVRNPNETLIINQVFQRVVRVFSTTFCFFPGHKNFQNCEHRNSQTTNDLKLHQVGFRAELIEEKTCLPLILTLIVRKIVEFHEIFAKSHEIHIYQGFFKFNRQGLGFRQGTKFEICWGLGCVRLGSLMRVHALRHVPNISPNPLFQKGLFQQTERHKLVFQVTYVKERDLSISESVY